MFLFTIIYIACLMLSLNFIFGVIIDPLLKFISKTIDLSVGADEVFWPMGFAIPICIFILYFSKRKEANNNINQVIDNLTLTGWSQLPYSVWVFCRLFQLARRARRRAPEQKVDGEMNFNFTRVQREDLAEMWRMGTPVEDEDDRHVRLEREHLPNLQGLFNPRGTIAHRAIEPIEDNMVRYW